MARNNGIASGASAIITGASTGIGKALAIELAKKHKCKMILNARSADILEETANQVRKAGGEAITVCGDIGDMSVVDKLAKTGLDNFETVDILINNAGFARPGRMDNIDLNDWRAVFEVNVFAPVALTYALLPHFLKSRKGKIVNIASVAGKVAFPGSVCYASSKFALTGFSEGMAAEYSGRGLDIITVCPGLVRTEFFKKNKNAQDITAMAEEKNLTGWMLKNVISISSEDAALDILKAMERGGSHEIVLTGPGKIIERIAGLCPPAAFYLSRFVPADRAPAAKTSTTPASGESDN
jgi:3-oxoacyl-[acyl-carrier protein] reductase